MEDYFVSEVSEEEIRREKQKARTLRQSQWWKRKRSSGRCHFCGRKFPPKELTMDHIVPIVRGGKSTRGNVVPACKECNSKKKYMLPLEWEEYLRKLREEEG
ncbi:MAG: HNH endonuclease [Nitrospirota bacterium]|jgi:5-methylcytosine-specific restriction endonuclease McrA